MRYNIYRRFTLTVQHMREIMDGIFLLIVVIGILALIFALYLSIMIFKAENGNERMQEIAGYISEGAMAFLKSEYKYLSIFVFFVSIAIFFAINLDTAIAFVIGASFSILAGYVGMKIATIANVKTAQAARSSQKEALKIAFSGGAVMGLSVVGLGIIGLGVLLIFFKGEILNIAGFGLGASSIALFARVGGGIYTKAADVGADLVGKIEANIPEDDPRNPAVIADNVGDNVGDVAGMGADLFESYVGSIISAITLGTLVFNLEGAFFALALAAIGIVSSIIGIIIVNYSKSNNPQKSLNLGTYTAGVLVLISTLVLSYVVFGNFKAFIPVSAGLIVGVLIGITTEMFTTAEFARVKRIASESMSGSATNIIAGMGEGMFSTMPPIIYIVVG